MYKMIAYISVLPEVLGDLHPFHVHDAAPCLLPLPLSRSCPDAGPAVRITQQPQGIKGHEHGGAGVGQDRRPEPGDAGDGALSSWDN